MLMTLDVSYVLASIIYFEIYLSVSPAYSINREKTSEGLNKAKLVELSQWNQMQLKK